MLYLEKEMLRTAIYVDGFNLFYGCLKGTPYKWLDLKAACQAVLAEHNEIVAIKYFTAMVSADRNPGAPGRQKAYIKALEAHIPELATIYGHYLSHPVSMPTVDPGLPRTVRVLKTEEKGSDVNIAVHLVNDAWKDTFDCAVIVSNDSDLVEAIRTVKQEHPEKVIGAILPLRKGRRASHKLKTSVDFVRQFRPATLATCQLPETLSEKAISRPSDW